jgi:hypothetical protein
MNGRFASEGNGIGGRVREGAAAGGGEGAAGMTTGEMGRLGGAKLEAGRR